MTRMRQRWALDPQRWTTVLWAVALYLISSTAWARPATVTLTSGETAEVDVVEMELGKQVKVRLSDGSEKTLPWEWITSIEMHATPNGAQAAIPQTSTSTDPYGAPVAVAPSAAVVDRAAGADHATSPDHARSPDHAAAPQPASLTKEQELLLLDAEIERIDEEMPGIGGPITLTSVGLGAGGLFVLMGAGLRTTCYDTIDESSCMTASTAFLVTGGVGIAAGAGGIAWLVARINARKPHRQKIHELEQKRDALRVGMDAGPTGALGTVSWNF